MGVTYKGRERGAQLSLQEHPPSHVAGFRNLGLGPPPATGRGQRAGHSREPSTRPGPSSPGAPACVAALRSGLPPRTAQRWLRMEAAEGVSYPPHKQTQTPDPASLGTQGTCVCIDGDTPCPGGFS